MSTALPQSIGIGSVVGTAVGNLLMRFPGHGELTVYVCAAAGGCIAPIVLARIARLIARARRVSALRLRWSGGGMAALGQ